MARDSPIGDLKVSFAFIATQFVDLHHTNMLGSIITTLLDHDQENL